LKLFDYFPFRTAPQPGPWDNHNPIREELFSAERLEEHARSLASAQPVGSRPTKGLSLHRRLADNSAVLLDAYHSIAGVVNEGQAITPAAEWLIDNYYVVERQIREIRSDLPPSYYRELPKLTEGPLKGYPRVFGIAWAFVAHNDSRFDPDLIVRFVRAYQEVQPLTIGELWAVAITLRIVLVENLRRIAERVVESRAARQEADAVADRLLGVAGGPRESAAAVLAAYAHRKLSDSFSVQLVHRLRDQDSGIALAIAWLDETLATQGTTADEAVRKEHQRQTAGTVTVRNIITSMRLISDVDWRALFEGMSLVDDVLGAGSAFAEMDFQTRDLYRGAVEQLARGSEKSELDIAQRAIAAARPWAADGDQRRGDPGYDLLAEGRRAFEDAIGFRPPLSLLAERGSRALGINGYVGTGAVVAGVLLTIPLALLARYGVGTAALVGLGLLGLVPAIDLAVAIVNRIITGFFGARRLPSMALRDGVPPELRTLVAVPTLLTSRASLDELLERLEVHYLASPGGDLHFALLTDWMDADAETIEGDDALLDAAIGGIARLNRRHGTAPAGDRFLLFHRRRTWNAGEGRWMGWERKRGKLHELNRVLRGATDGSFVVPGPGARPPEGIRFVITLDSDTRTPHDTVRRLIGKMAHPINRPRFDAAVGRVVEGYGVLQPRVTPLFPIAGDGSLFQRVFSANAGIDPYVAAVSDVYQDLYGEGSYAGKGIYDVDVFEAALAGRVPDETLLSHDLFEGIFARAGVASDIEVVEEFPGRYDVAALRDHRWARGDWQLLPWIFGRGPAAKIDPRLASVTGIGRAKMLDNLRRTLSAPSAAAALIAGWTLPFQAAAVWTAFVLATLVIPPLLPVLGSIVPARPGISLRSHVQSVLTDLGLALMQVVLTISFLAHRAWLMGDAIIRTLTRVLLTRRHLLQWVPAAQARIGRTPNRASFFRWMAGAPALGVLSIGAVLLARSDAWGLMLPFAALWLVSPEIALRASTTRATPRNGALPERDRRALRMIARRTWRFFETFVTPADNMLPPDNFQEDPVPVVAHRTSPTNIGLYLLSVASARDFGWIGTAAAVERLEATFATLAVLERFRGHFYNWYDTRDLRALDPRYVSSVDSGNLAGHLITLANACRDWRNTPVDEAQRWSGVADALVLLRQEADALRGERAAQSVPWHHLDDSLTELTAGIEAPHDGATPPTDRFGKLAATAETMVDIARTLANERGDAGADLAYWAEATYGAIADHCRDLDLSAPAEAGLSARLLALEQKSRALALGMEFGFLINHDRELLSIGYLVPEGVLDGSCYDLLASEARLASFFAIAKGDVRARHWFRLGRAITQVGGGAVLISWSGSMFEYLMPSLVMRAPDSSLLEQTNRLIVRRQIEYAGRLGLPWGISESAYNVRDLEATYQYSNFGVPGLGLKRGLAENTVIAPYATALSSMVAPAKALRNFESLALQGGSGRYGFYEALDYTPGRVPEGEKVAIVRAFMAHHQGMSIVAIADALFDGRMRARFHAEPIVMATELLLQERPPRDVAVARPFAAEAAAIAVAHEPGPIAGRHITNPHTATPATHLLSNGRYTVMMTAAGSGYSRWGDIAVTRWREDATLDGWGSYVFLRDARNGDVWSAGYQPCGVDADGYEASFTEDRAELTRTDGSVTTRMEVLVSAEDDAEVRRVSVTNSGNLVREIDVTSYMELVLASQAADVAHPAFSKMFVETEYLADVGAIIATRRRRGPDEPEIWAAHLVVADGGGAGRTEIETDRARFLGRGRGPGTAVAIGDGRPLSNTTGTVLDPIFAMRRRVRVAPGGIVHLAFWTMVAGSRAALMDLIDKHHDTNAFERAAALAWTQAQVQLHHLGIDPGEAGLFQRLASHLIYASPTARASSSAITRGAGPQSGLWPLGISGDIPILLLRVSEPEDEAVARELIQAHEYLRLRRLAVDLVILNERASSYVQDLQLGLEALMRANLAKPPAGLSEPPGRIFIVRADLISAEVRALLISVARVVLVAQRGRLSEQLDVSDRSVAPTEPRPRKVARVEPVTAPPVPKDLEFFNGLGGFGDDGREYVIQLAPGLSTPAPWINVIANPDFGFQVAAEGGGATWAVNSRENGLTPWSNDPVAAPSGEALYLRDEETGELWSPTAFPIREPEGTYVARHGRGFSRFDYSSHGIDTRLLQFVPLADPIKVSRLTLRNSSSRPRRISVTTYAEWVLGQSRGAAAPFTITEVDAETNAVFARNAWNAAFGGRVAFADLAGRQTSWTGDRREFLGRNGSLGEPTGLTETKLLSGVTGAGFDPCAALATSIELRPGEAVDVCFFLGQAATAEEARRLVVHYRSADLDAVLGEVLKAWDEVLGTVQVKTPERSMDLMLNGWLLYQTLACRIFARSAFYQASGAYGFRDQLQDGMAIVGARPDITRAHILRSAARQFAEGDVQHWWLPHSGQGVRTRISDDRVWLGYATAHYIATTGDAAVLDEKVPFIDGPRLAPEEHDSFFQPGISDEVATLFEHCALALDKSLALGRHSLPLIGTGDWNDGMNLVGEKGKGESVWLGWFLYATLQAFAPIAAARGDAKRASTWGRFAAALKAALGKHGWDGDWYRRGYFDDGTPLGSATSLECRIDSIAQSWAVLSGAGDATYAAKAMASVSRTLIRPETRLALLFDPPFDKTPLDPGYIKGYPPGLRENGGQYTHGALWAVMAFAALGQGNEAARLFGLINPIKSSSSRAGVLRYKVEPYVVAADVYANPSHVGRGGWTWYTGSAGWMQRAGMEAILGLQMRGDCFELDPCIPNDWPGFSLRLRHRTATYEIEVTNAGKVGRGVRDATLDGVAVPSRPLRVALVDDGEVHRLLVTLGPASGPQ
jgi:cyclic beta-1,2-glucan synthetase